MEGSVRPGPSLNWLRPLMSFALGDIRSFDALSCHACFSSKCLASSQCSLKPAFRTECWAWRSCTAVVLLLIHSLRHAFDVQLAQRRHKAVQEVDWPEQVPVPLAHLRQWPTDWLCPGFSGSPLTLDQRGSASRRCAASEVRPSLDPTRCPLPAATTRTVISRVGLARDPAQITAIYGLNVKV